MNATSELAFLQDDRLHTIAEVEAAMMRLDIFLKKTSLEALANFNHTYLVITRNVRQARDQGQFSYPDFLQLFDRRFAHYYFAALQAYIAGKPAAPVWQEAFTAARGQSASPLILMALGVNAHVNNDIPQVLRDAAASRHYRDDYDRVNDIIKDSVYEVIDGLQPGGAVLHPRHAVLKPLFKKSMDLVVPRWRNKAWGHFESLRDGTTDVTAIEDYAMLMKHEIVRMPV